MTAFKYDTDTSYAHGTGQIGDRTEPNDTTTSVPKCSTPYNPYYLSLVWMYLEVKFV
jgi:hypothetical protein